MSRTTILRPCQHAANALAQAIERQRAAQAVAQANRDFLAGLPTITTVRQPLRPSAPTRSTP